MAIKRKCKRICSELPIELLELIAERVVSISDFIRFRSVCKSWRNAAVPSKLRPQPPILLLPYNIFKPDRYFFSIATRRTYHVSLPQLVGKKIFDCSNGWMLLFDVQTRALSLHNPFSLASIQLPLPSNLEHTIDCGHLLYDRCTDNYVVLIHHDNPYDATWWFFKVGVDSWRVLKNSNFYSSSDRFIYHKGKFFTSQGSDIYIDDGDAGAVSFAQSLPAGSVSDIPETSMGFDVRFVTADGELFIAVDFPHEYEGYALYKLQYLVGQRIMWSRVPVEDCALFISNEQAILFSADDDFPQYKKKITYSARFSQYVTQHTLRTISCEDDTTDFMLCGWERPADFDNPSMWITPSFQ